MTASASREVKRTSTPSCSRMGIRMLGWWRCTLLLRTISAPAPRTQLAFGRRAADSVLLPRFSSGGAVLRLAQEYLSPSPLPTACGASSQRQKLWQAGNLQSACRMTLIRSSSCSGGVSSNSCPDAMVCAIVSACRRVLTLGSSENGRQKRRCGCTLVCR